MKLWGSEVVGGEIYGSEVVGVEVVPGLKSLGKKYTAVKLSWV